MKKLMISQPMAGWTKTEIKEAQRRARHYAFLEGYEVVDTYIEKACSGGVRETNISLWYLAKSLEKMAECDAVYFVRGWQGARGCELEYEAAGAYGLVRIYES